ncbi:MAG: caspase family protein [Pseudomonadales bacterium]
MTRNRLMQAQVPGFVLGCLLLAAGPSLAASQRVALVVGNANYPESPLENPVRDARAIAARLRSLEFEVVEVIDADLKEMQRGLVEFLGAIDEGATALVFYAGHGIQANGRNYLMPIDATLESEMSLRFDAMELNDVLEELERSGSRTNIIVLDACRNNPFERKFRGGSRGLAVVDAAMGTLIAYATAPGSVASDGEGENGLYTSALLRVLDEPGLKVEEVFKRVRNQVSAASNNAQIPWESSSLTGDFVFNAAPAAIMADRALQPATDKEGLLWSSIRGSEHPEDFRDYLTAFPTGVFAGVATRRIQELEDMGSGGQCEDLTDKYYVTYEGKSCADIMTLTRQVNDRYHMSYNICGAMALVTNVQGEGKFANGAISVAWSSLPCAGVTQYSFDEACQVGTGKIIERKGLPGVCHVFVNKNVIVDVVRAAKEN